MLIVPRSTDLRLVLLATQIPRVLSTSNFGLCLRYAAYGYTDAVSSVMCRVRPTHSCSLVRFANKVSPLPLCQKRRGLHKEVLKGGVFAARRFIAPPLVSKVSLRFGHARGKTTLSCFLTLSRRYATPMATLKCAYRLRRYLAKRGN